MGVLKALTIHKTSGRFCSRGGSDCALGPTEDILQFSGLDFPVFLVALSDAEGVDPREPFAKFA